MSSGGAVTALDGPALAAALRGGIRRVIARQEHLNKINVFPVPDGDTGTNLALTLTAVLNALRGEVQPAGDLLARVADAAIDGARGNSGAILAQFFVGFADGAAQLRDLNGSQFAHAAQRGSEYARESLSEPREGTLLTVLADFADEARILARDPPNGDLVELLRRALVRARASLETTRTQLDALRRADVVDAGALGFVELVQGMYDHLAGVSDESIEASLAATEPEEEAAAGDEIDTTHRFCTECVIAGQDIDRRKLREAIGALGGSVVIAGTRNKAKVHVHVDDPAAVFDAAARFGAVSGRKADDLRLQQGAAHHRPGQHVVVVVDSAADIPEAQLETLGIHVIPLRVHFGERSYLDKVSLTQEEFYRELAANPVHPKTSQPPPGDFRRTFEFLASHYATVVSIDVSSRLSGTLSAAQGAASRVQGRGKVIVIDSLNASVGQGLIAMYAAECARAGQGGDAVVAGVRAIIPRTLAFGLVGRLDFAVRGGRLPRVVKTIADLLRVTPVLFTRPDGRVRTGAILFGRKRALAKFARLIRRRMDPHTGYRVAVGHASAETEGRRLLAEISEGSSNVCQQYLVPLGTALGVHGGPGMLVAALQEYEAPSAAVAGASPS